MATTHTPGPWVYDPDCGYIRGTDGRDWPVGEQGETGLSIEGEHARIRADRLIMAAGFDLLQAGRAVMRVLARHGEAASDEGAALANAIAKAEGR